MLPDHKSDTVITITVSASVVGTELVQAAMDAGYVFAEADAGVLRAKLNGGNRIERIALLPTALAIVGAATVLGQRPREVARLIRARTLRTARRGRHFHIDRAAIEECKRAAR